MRVFIAIELGKEIKEALSKIQDELKTVQGDVKWVEPQNIHLTLKFLGEIEENKIPKISQTLKAISCQVRPFMITLSELGAFPSHKYPRVIWIGIAEGKTELSKLVELIEDSLVKLKFPKEKRGFSAHFTLGRVKSARRCLPAGKAGFGFPYSQSHKSEKNRESLCHKLNIIQVPELKQEIKSIVLFKSTLTSKGPFYEKISEESF